MEILVHRRVEFHQPEKRSEKVKCKPGPKGFHHEQGLYNDAETNPEHPRKKTNPMKNSYFQILLGLLSVFFFAAESHGQMAVKGRLLLADDFKTPAEYIIEKWQPLRDGWRMRAWHGSWRRTSEGIESGWETGHNPNLAYEGSFTNAVIELEFRFHKEPGKTAYIQINATNLQLDPNAYSVSAWANVDAPQRPVGLLLEHQGWASQGFTIVANQTAAIEPDKWYSMRLEMIDDYALISCNGVTIVGRHDKFGLPKTLLAIGVGYCPHELRNLRVYEATANPAWTKPAAASLAK